jgi:hypothetical protein
MAPSLWVAEKIRPYFILALDGGPVTALGLGFPPQRRRPIAGGPGFVLAGFSLATLPASIRRHTLVFAGFENPGFQN